MAQSIGKVNSNGTLNDGSFYSIQDVDVLMDGVTGDIDDIEGDITDIEGDITTISGNITSLTGRVAALENSSGGSLVILEKYDDGENDIIQGYTAKQLYDGYVAGNRYALKTTLTVGGSAEYYNELVYVMKSGTTYAFMFLSVAENNVPAYLLCSATGDTGSIIISS